MTEAAKLSFLQKGLDQVALIVDDLDQAVRAYWEKFGIGPWRIFTYGRPMLQGMRYHGQPAEFRFRTAFGQVGGMRLELIQVVEGHTIYDDYAQERGYGLHHVGVLVEDMAQALEEARQAGIAVLQEGWGFGLDGDGHFAYLDTIPLIGMIVELIHVPARRNPPDEVYPPEQG